MMTASITLWHPNVGGDNGNNVIEGKSYEHSLIIYWTALVGTNRRLFMCPRKSDYTIHNLLMAVAIFVVLNDSS